MFEPFPDNYVWNLSAGIALAAGGLIGEVDRACRPLRDLKTADEDEATHAFFQSWCAVADGLEPQSELDALTVRTSGGDVPSACNPHAHGRLRGTKRCHGCGRTRNEIAIDGDR